VCSSDLLTVLDSRVSVSAEDIKNRPITTVDALLEQVASVKTNANGEVFVRGGRAGEVAYIVDSRPIGDLYGGIGASLSPVPLSHGGSTTVNAEPFDAMFFEHYGVNPFVDTDEDNLSTFAIDVDDASFAITRSYIDRGFLPPRDAVRVEEFVNHFKYKYDSPKQEAFRVSLECAPSPYGAPGARLLRIGLKGRMIDPRSRTSANLVFVIDVSGSMDHENRLELVKKSLRMLVNELRPDDRVGIVVYGSVGRVVLEPTGLTKRETIVRAIEGLETEGATNAEHGIRLGYEMANRLFDPEKINRIILCSDGVANVGQTGPKQILEQIKAYADKGITLSTVGFGMGNYNDVLMEKLGDKGNGHYAYVDDLAAAHRIFVENLTGTLQVIARDVKVQVEFNPRVVRSYRLLGYENRDVADDKFRDDKEDGGELGSGHATTALYELKLYNDTPGQYLGTVYVRHKHPETGEVTEVNEPFSTSLITPEYAHASADFKLAAVAAEFAEILRGSYWARESTLDNLYNDVAGMLLQLADTDATELVRLIDKARRCKDERAEQ
jgi:Ca-activated chloride channel family protein